MEPVRVGRKHMYHLNLVGGLCDNVASARLHVYTVCCSVGEFRSEGFIAAEFSENELLKHAFTNELDIVVLSFAR
jgi:hypothetical protein